MIGYLINIVFVLFVLVFGVICINKYTTILNYKKMSIFLPIIIVLFYFSNIIVSYNSGGITFLFSVLPISNISPMLFTLTFVSLFLKHKEKEKLYKFMSIFTPAMSLAALTTSLYPLLFGITNYRPYILLDALAHVFFFLYFYYLIRFDFIKLTLKDTLFAVANVTMVILLVTGINLIFKTGFFGLNFYGRHNIYGVKITRNPIVSYFLYVFGAYGVIFIGYFLISKYQNMLSQEKSIATNS